MESVWDTFYGVIENLSGGVLKPRSPPTMMYIKISWESFKTTSGEHIEAWESPFLENSSRFRSRVGT